MKSDNRIDKRLKKLLSLENHLDGTLASNRETGVLYSFVSGYDLLRESCNALWLASLLYEEGSSVILSLIHQPL